MRRSHQVRALVVLACGAATGLAAIASCSPKGFDPESLIESVRILASRSDQPYAKPGATVRSEILAFDGRPDASSNEPMKLYWLPILCINPPNDAYYGCFPELAGNKSLALVGVDGGAAARLSRGISAWDGGADAAVAGGGGVVNLGDGGFPALPTGMDLGPLLIAGDKVVFQLPTDIVTSHPPVKGADAYGVAIAFNIACAGHVEALPIDPTNLNPVQMAIGCFNVQHQQLGANDYVLGYTQVFAYDKLTNHNPVIQSFQFQGRTLAIDAGMTAPISVAVCTDSGTSKCPNLKMGALVPDASQEPDPQNPGPDGGPLGEQLWVDFYTTMGTLGDDALLLFDPTTGRIAPGTTNLQAPSTAQKGTLWAVVHDNRGGATWVTVPAVAK